MDSSVDNSPPTVASSNALLVALSRVAGAELTNAATADAAASSHLAAGLVSICPLSSSLPNELASVSALASPSSVASSSAATVAVKQINYINRKCSNCDASFDDTVEHRQSGFSHAALYCSADCAAAPHAPVSHEHSASSMNNTVRSMQRFAQDQSANGRTVVVSIVDPSQNRVATRIGHDGFTGKQSIGGGDDTDPVSVNLALQLSHVLLGVIGRVTAALLSPSSSPSSSSSSSAVSPTPSAPFGLTAADALNLMIAARKRQMAGAPVEVPVAAGADATVSSATGVSSSAAVAGGETTTSLAPASRSLLAGALSALLYRIRHLELAHSALFGKPDGSCAGVAGAYYELKEMELQRVSKKQRKSACDRGMEDGAADVLDPHSAAGPLSEPARALAEAYKNAPTEATVARLKDAVSAQPDGSSSATRLSNREAADAIAALLPALIAAEGAVCSFARVWRDTAAVFVGPERRSRKRQATAAAEDTAATADATADATSTDARASAAVAATSTSVTFASSPVSSFAAEAVAAAAAITAIAAIEARSSGNSREASLQEKEEEDAAGDGDDAGSNEEDEEEEDDGFRKRRPWRGRGRSGRGSWRGGPARGKRSRSPSPSPSHPKFKPLLVKLEAFIRSTAMSKVGTPEILLPSLSSSAGETGDPLSSSAASVSTTSPSNVTSLTSRSPAASSSPAVTGIVALWQTRRLRFRYDYSYGLRGSLPCSFEAHAIRALNLLERDLAAPTVYPVYSTSTHSPLYREKQYGASCPVHALSCLFGGSIGGNSLFSTIGLLDSLLVSTLATDSKGHQFYSAELRPAAQSPMGDSPSEAQQDAVLRTLSCVLRNADGGDGAGCAAASVALVGACLNDSTRPAEEQPFVGVVPIPEGTPFDNAAQLFSFVAERATDVREGRKCVNMIVINDDHIFEEKTMVPLPGVCPSPVAFTAMLVFYSSESISSSSRTSYSIGHFVSTLHHDDSMLSSLPALRGQPGRAWVFSDPMSSTPSVFFEHARNQQYTLPLSSPLFTATHRVALLFNFPAAWDEDRKRLVSAALGRFYARRAEALSWLGAAALRQPAKEALQHAKA